MRILISSLLGILAAVGLAASVRAETPPMSKIVVRISTIGVAGDPIPAKPKTMYLAGVKFARVEDKLDKEANRQTLIITNEPDSWMINLADKTGRHVVDAGPKFETQAPVFWTISGQPEPDFVDLQFGAEMKFFGEGRGLELKPRTVEGKKYKVLSIKTGQHEATLLLDPKTSKPFQIDLVKFGRLVSTVRYLTYQTKLPFNPALFQPPAGITFSEGG